MATANDYIFKRLEAIEREIAVLKRLLLAGPKQTDVVTFEGIWEGAKVSDEDIDEAKRSLFKPAYDGDT